MLGGWGACLSGEQDVPRRVPGGGVWGGGGAVAYIVLGVPQHASLFGPFYQCT